MVSRSFQVTKVQTKIAQATRAPILIASVKDTLFGNDEIVKHLDGQANHKE